RRPSPPRNSKYRGIFDFLREIQNIEAFSISRAVPQDAIVGAGRQRTSATQRCKQVGLNAMAAGWSGLTDRAWLWLGAPEALQFYGERG
ncbi:hypothetical protein ACLOJK_040110, partial [Asimina triloba]